MDKRMHIIYHLFIQLCSSVDPHRLVFSSMENRLHCSIKGSFKP